VTGGGGGGGEGALKNQTPSTSQCKKKKNKHYCCLRSLLNVLVEVPGGGQEGKEKASSHLMTRIKNFYHHRRQGIKGGLGGTNDPVIPITRPWAKVSAARASRGGGVREGPAHGFHSKHRIP